MSGLEKLLARPKFGPPGALERVVQSLEGLIHLEWWQEGRVIKIAGSNGKGTCAHMLERLALKNGLKVATYTSPHLLFVHERIRLNGHNISEAAFDEALHWALSRSSLTAGRYEILTVAAVYFFAKEKVDLAIMEVGLGGRLDPVRMAPGRVCLLTSIDLEHRAILGDRLEDIASEKAHVAKPGDVLITGFPLQGVKVPENIDLLDLSDNSLSAKDLNRALACNAFHLQTGLTVSLDDLDGFQVPGRFQRLASQPSLIVDVAHSPKAVQSVLDQVTAETISIVLGMKADKNMKAICELVSARATSVALVCLNADMVGANELRSYVSNSATCATDRIETALHFARETAGKDGVVLCLGGFDVVRHVICFYNGLDPEGLTLL